MTTPLDGRLATFFRIAARLDALCLVLGADGSVSAHCERSAEELHYRPEELVGLRIFDINPSMSRLQWRQLWEDTTAAGDAPLDTELITRDGVIFPVDANVFHLNESNKPLLVMLAVNRLAANRLENLLRLTASISSIGGWEDDLVTGRFSITDELYNILETSSAEDELEPGNVAQLLAPYLSPTDLNNLRSDMKACRTEGRRLERSYSLLLSEERTKYIRLTAIPIFVEETLARIYGTIQDITSQQQQEIDLRIRQLSLDQAQEAFIWVDESGALTYANRPFFSIYGYQPKQLDRLHIRDLEPGFRESGSWEQHWQELRTARSRTLESVNERADGSVFPVDVNLFFVEYGGRARLCAVLRDVSELRERERSLQLFKTTVETSSDYIIWADESGIPFYANEAWLQFQNITREECYRRPLEDFSATLRERTYPVTWERVRIKGSMRYESTAENGRGDRLDVLINARHLTSEGREYVVFVITDISQQYLQRQELSSALDEVKELTEQLSQEKDYLEQELADQFKFENIISRDPAYKKVLQQVGRVAETSATVLILGETGTGKELLARAVHNLSGRAKRPLVTLNCAALPANLIESELFGHEKGAFTGAVERKIGRFEVADQGTIFLDEIGELPLGLQAKLLRVLQEGEFERLGSTRTLSTDVRIIAATNRNLSEQVKAGRFREDLYFRLNVFPIVNIPLRERREDIPLLIEFFTKRFADKVGRKIERIPQGTVNRLINYNFPGNIRELENIVERAVILSQDNTLNLAAVMPDKNPAAGAGGQREEEGFLSFEEMQRRHIIAALERTYWRVSGPYGAAKLLGLNDKTLSSKMRKLKINRRDFIRL